MTGDQSSAVGWAERPGGGMLARMLAEAFHSAEQSDRDSQPCATCGKVMPATSSGTRGNEPVAMTTVSGASDRPLRPPRPCASTTRAATPATWGEAIEVPCR